MNSSTEQDTTTLHAQGVSRLTTATPEEVWEVLADGWSYPSWVVGTARMRAVEPSFPSPGARLHHSFGTWPLAVDDETVCLVMETNRRLVLEAHGWPLGEARVEIALQPTGAGTEISIMEDATTGPGRWAIPRPARQAVIKVRNTETLRRLAYLAERAPSP